jgi:hypothetical protein
LHFTPHAPQPATPSILKILAPTSYHWIARFVFYLHRRHGDNENRMNN